MITQIYEAVDVKEAKSLVKAGVDLIGVVANLKGNYPGVLNTTKAKKVLKSINDSGAKGVLLPFSENLKEIVEITIETKPDILHIAAEPGTISPDDIKTLKNKFPRVQLMRTIPVSDEQSIKLAKQYDKIVDYLLLDSRSNKDGHIGVTGETHDWSISRRIVESVSVPIILAGGIGPDNVASAIKKVRPYGVDSKTKTDIPGTNKKDFKKVKRFVKIAKET